MLNQWLESGAIPRPLAYWLLAHGRHQLPSSVSISFRSYISYTVFRIISSYSTSKFTKYILSLTVSEFVPLNNMYIQSLTSVECILVDNDEPTSLSGWCGHILVVKP